MKEFDFESEIKVYNVSAGHRWNNKFMNKLRYLIDNARNTLSFNVGTHVGYCISLNKPHSICRLNWTQLQRGKISEEDLYFKQDKERASALSTVEKVFTVNYKLNDSITFKQKETINEYWGV